LADAEVEDAESEKEVLNVNSDPREVEITWEPPRTEQQNLSGGAGGSSVDVEPTSPVLASVGEAFLDASRTRTESVEELSWMVQMLVKEEATRQTTDPLTGRPVSDGGVSKMGVGRGKPLNEADPQARFGDPFGGMGMGRGKALAPPPGFGSSASRRIRAPGGLSKEWRPEPPIPEEELDPELQDFTSSSEYWSRDVEAPSHLFLAAAAAARFRNDEERSVWSKASYCGTPSMAWSKTPSPPGTPCMMSRGFPEYAPPVAQVAHGLPMYVQVPVVTTYSCPHCGGPFAIAADAAAGPGWSSSAPTQTCVRPPSSQLPVSAFAQAASVAQASSQGQVQTQVDEGPLCIDSEDE
jgi:hypothetical protein